jgi:iron complex outermembrane recepter protein
MRGDHGNTTLRGSHYGGEFHLLEASGPEAGDSTGGPVRQTLDDRLQVTNDYLTHGIRFETKAQWQRHGLTEVSDDCQPVPPATTCTKVKDQVAFGLVLNTGTVDLLAHHTMGSHVTGTVGVSGMYQLSSTTGPIFLVPSATTTSAAAFGFEQATVGVITFVGGLRGDTRHLSSDASAPLALSADTRSWSNATADAGLVVRPAPNFAVVGNFGTGWRAPTLFDLYTNGPNVADARYEIGDPSLKSERARNIDGGVRWESNRLHADATLFQNDVDDFIYTAPTAQTIGTLQVFRHQQTNARLHGIELSGALDVAAPLTVRASYDYTNGTDRTSGKPLPLMPPARTIVGAELHSSTLGWAQRASIGAEIERNQTQTRLGDFDVPTAGYTLFNLDFRMDRVVRAKPFRFDIDVRNATNVTYKDFMSRYKRFAYAPGVNVILKASAGAW